MKILTSSWGANGGRVGGATSTVKVFDEDITPQQINALSDTKAIKELALIMTQVEESDDDEEEEEEE